MPAGGVIKPPSASSSVVINSLANPLSNPGGVLTLSYNANTLSVNVSNQLTVNIAAGGGLQSTGSGISCVGVTEDVPVVCDVTCSSGVVTVFKRTLSFANGLLQSSGSCA